MANKPTTELVSVAWLKTLEGLPSEQIGTTLPSDQTQWPDGFVQATAVGGSPSRYVPLRNPVVSVDVWYNNPTGNKVPWGKANDLVNIVRDACYGRKGIELEIGGADYFNARLLSIYPLTEPRRVPDDPAGYAHYTMDVAMHFVALETVS